MIYSKIEGSGFPLLIIHGFLGMSDNWKTIAQQYATLNYEVHLLDMRNHGRSFHSDEFSYELMVDDVLNYCKSKKITNMFLLGHSMGGKVAMLFASCYAELVNKLIVADIGSKFYAPHHQAILSGLNAIDFDLKPSRAAIDLQLSEAIPDFGTRQFLLKNLYWKTSDQLDFRFNLKVLTEKISQIGAALPPNAFYKKATLFIRGGKSDYILDTDIIDIKYHFPEMILETIPDTGHWLHAENAQLFVSKTEQFLKQ